MRSAPLVLLALALAAPSRAGDAPPAPDAREEAFNALSTRAEKALRVPAQLPQLAADWEGYKRQYGRAKLDGDESDVEQAVYGILSPDQYKELLRARADSRFPALAHKAGVTWSDEIIWDLDARPPKRGSFVHESDRDSFADLQLLKTLLVEFQEAPPAPAEPAASPNRWTPPTTGTNEGFLEALSRGREQTRAALASGDLATSRQNLDAMFDLVGKLRAEEQWPAGKMRGDYRRMKEDLAALREQVASRAMLPDAPAPAPAPRPAPRQAAAAPAAPAPPRRDASGGGFAGIWRRALDMTREAALAARDGLRRDSFAEAEGWGALELGARTQELLAARAAADSSAPPDYEELLSDYASLLQERVMARRLVKLRVWQQRAEAALTDDPLTAEGRELGASVGLLQGLAEDKKRAFVEKAYLAAHPEAGALQRGDPRRFGAAIETYAREHQAELERALAADPEFQAAVTALTGGRDRLREFYARHPDLAAHDAKLAEQRALVARALAAGVVPDGMGVDPAVLGIPPGRVEPGTLALKVTQDGLPGYVFRDRQGRDVLVLTRPDGSTEQTARSPDGSGPTEVVKTSPDGRVLSVESGRRNAAGLLVAGTIETSEGKTTVRSVTITDSGQTYRGISHEFVSADGKKASRLTLLYGPQGPAGYIADHPDGDRFLQLFEPTGVVSKRLWKKDGKWMQENFRIRDYSLKGGGVTAMSVVDGALVLEEADGRKHIDPPGGGRYEQKGSVITRPGGATEETLPDGRVRITDPNAGEMVLEQKRDGALVQTSDGAGKPQSLTVSAAWTKKLRDAEPGDRAFWAGEIASNLGAELGWTPQKQVMARALIERLSQGRKERLNIVADPAGGTLAISLDGVSYIGKFEKSLRGSGEALVVMSNSLGLDAATTARLDRYRPGKVNLPSSVPRFEAGADGSVTEYFYRVRDERATSGGHFAEVLEVHARYPGGQEQLVAEYDAQKYMTAWQRFSKAMTEATPLRGVNAAAKPFMDLGKLLVNLGDAADTADQASYLAAISREYGLNKDEEAAMSRIMSESDMAQAREVLAFYFSLDGEKSEAENKTRKTAVLKEILDSLKNKNPDAHRAVEERLMRSGLQEMKAGLGWQGHTEGDTDFEDRLVRRMFAPSDDQLKLQGFDRQSIDNRHKDILDRASEAHGWESAALYAYGYAQHTSVMVAEALPAMIISGGTGAFSRVAAAVQGPGEIMMAWGIADGLGNALSSRGAESRYAASDMIANVGSLAALHYGSKALRGAGPEGRKTEWGQGELDARVDAARFALRQSPAPRRRFGELAEPAGRGRDPVFGESQAPLKIEGHKPAGQESYPVGSATAAGRDVFLKTTSEHRPQAMLENEAAVGARAHEVYSAGKLAPNVEVVRSALREVTMEATGGYPGLEGPGAKKGEAVTRMALVVEKGKGRALDDFGPNERIPAEDLAGLESSVKALHDAGVAHGDLSGANILAYPDPANPGHFKFVLFDFGLGALESSGNGPFRRAAANDAANLAGIRARYEAPSVAAEKRYGALADPGTPEPARGPPSDSIPASADPARELIRRHGSDGAPAAQAYKLAADRLAAAGLEVQGVAGSFGTRGKSPRMHGWPEELLVEGKTERFTFEDAQKLDKMPTDPSIGARLTGRNKVLFDLKQKMLKEGGLPSDLDVIARGDHMNPAVDQARRRIFEETGVYIELVEPRDGASAPGSTGPKRAAAAANEALLGEAARLHAEHPERVVGTMSSELIATQSAEDCAIRSLSNHPVIREALRGRSYEGLLELAERITGEPLRRTGTNRIQFLKILDALGFEAQHPREYFADGNALAEHLRAKGPQLASLDLAAGGHRVMLAGGLFDAATGQWKFMVVDSNSPTVRRMTFAELKALKLATIEVAPKPGMTERGLREQVDRAWRQPVEAAAAVERLGPGEAGADQVRYGTSESAAADELAIARKFEQARSKYGLDAQDLVEAQGLARQMREAGLARPPVVDRLFYDSYGELPHNGIKLRVGDFSGPPEQAAAGRRQILSAFLDIVSDPALAKELHFKVALCMKTMTGTQAGKFITIWTENPAAALKFAERLDAALAAKGLRGARLPPEDRAFGRSGLVAWRYGGYKDMTLRVADGRGGTKVIPDNRSDFAGNLREARFEPGIEPWLRLGGLEPAAPARPARPAAPAAPRAPPGAMPASYRLQPNSGGEAFDYSRTGPLRLSLGGGKTLEIRAPADLPAGMARPAPDVKFLLIDPADPARQYKGLREGQPVEIGRAEPGRFVISGDVSAEHMKVSGRHLSISVREGKIILEDLNSRNGTFVTPVAPR